MRNSIKKPLFRIFDLVTVPFNFLFLPVLKTIRKYGVENFPLNRKTFLKLGVFPVRDHYYEPQLVYSNQFDAKKIRQLAIDFDLEKQVKSLQLLAHREELGHFKLDGSPEDGTYYINNLSFSRGDADLYYLLIRNIRPKKIIEIGSGFTTLLSIAAAAKNKLAGQDTNITCIEPFEMAWLDKIPGITLVRESVEKIDLAFFNQLDENDILFIDSSHVIRPENDVLFEYLQILPSLKKGVIIHIHDIFTPRHYRAEWLRDELRFWNEQYLLEAFLYYNDSFEIMYSLNHLKNDAYGYTKEVLMHINESCEPGSFWLLKIK